MNSKNKLKFYFPLLVIILFSYNISFATTLKETFKKQLTCDGRPELEIKNSNGRIEVFSWDKNKVQIIAHIRVEGKEPSAQKMIDRIEIEIEQNGNEIFVETLIPKGMKGHGGFFSWLFGDGRFSYSVDYEINVPIESDLNLNTTNGGISVEEVSGRIKIHSTNGKINAREVSGLVRCETTNGRIHAEINKITSDEEMTFRTTNGSIKIYLPEEYGGYADLKTTNGHIDSDFRLYDERRNSRKSKKFYRGDFGTGEGSITCKTTNGSIYLLKNN